MHLGPSLGSTFWISHKRFSVRSETSLRIIDTRAASCCTAGCHRSVAIVTTTSPGLMIFRALRRIERVTVRRCSAVSMAARLDRSASRTLREAERTTWKLFAEQYVTAEADQGDEGQNCARGDRYQEQDLERLHIPVRGCARHKALEQRSHALMMTRP